jgi:hypothetical protein
MDTPAVAIPTEEAGDIALTVVETKSVNVEDMDINEDVVEEETEEDIIRRIVREELKKSLIGSATAAFNDLNDLNEEMTQEDHNSLYKSPSMKRLSSAKDLNQDAIDVSKQPSSAISVSGRSNNASMQPTDTKEATTRLSMIVEAMEALDAVVTPERPSTVCGFCMSLLLPIVFIIYLMVRLDQVYSAAPLESSYLVPAHGLHATIRIKCVPVNNIVPPMALLQNEESMSGGPEGPEGREKGPGGPAMFDMSSCNAMTAAGQAFGPRKGGGSDGGPGGGNADGPPSGGKAGGGNTGGGNTGGGNTGGSSGGGNAGGGNGGPKGGGNGGPKGGGNGGPRSGGGRRLIDTSNSQSYCTVTVNYAKGLCGPQRDNNTGTIISQELYPNENTDGDSSWTWTLDATGIDHPTEIDVPMCSSSDNSDFIQVNGVSDNTTKISIVNTMMYRDNTTKIRNDQWIRKYKPEIWKNYYVGELEVIPKSNLPQILTLTRYNLTYYPKYLNTTEMKSLTASYKFTDKEAVSTKSFYNIFFFPMFNFT